MEALALIGGTGLDHWGEAQGTHALDTPYGPHSGPIARFDVGGRTLWFLPRHGADHRLAPHLVNYRANLWALKSLGAERVLAVNAVGGITARCAPGSLVVPDGVIDYTYGREHTFSDSAEVPLVHTEFAHPFEGPLRDAVVAAAGQVGVAFTDGGCVGVCQGPRFETAHEVRRLARDGCDVVGMTSMPEAVLARELGLDYAAIQPVANWAAGVDDAPISVEAIDETLRGAVDGIRRIIAALLGDRG